MSKEKRVDLEDERRKILEAYYYTFTSPTGAAVLEDMKRSTVYKTSIVEGDSHATYAKEGAREFVLKIMRIIDGFEKPAKKPKVETEGSENDDSGG